MPYFCHMKKTLLYGLLVLVLGAATWYFIFKDTETAFSTSEANFHVASTNDIGIIYMTDLHNNAVKLTRKGEQWTLNDSLIPRPDALQLLLDALTKQRPQQPVAAGYHDAAVRELSANSTKVEIYSPDGKKTHTFYVAQNPGYNNVSYMLTEGAKRPFIVDIPLRHLFLGLRYFTDVQEWTTKQLFVGQEPIETLSVQYIDSTQHSFQLQAKGTSWAISGQTPPATPLNTERVQQYLALFETVYCMGYETEIDGNDALNKSRHLATLTLQRKGLKPAILDIYFRPTNKRTKSAIRIGSDEYDANTFLGRYNQQLVLLSRKQVNNMMRYFSEFYESNQTPQRQLSQPDTSAQ